MSKQDKSLVLFLAVAASVLHLLGYFSDLTPFSRTAAFVMGSITAGNASLYMMWKMGWIRGSTQGSE